MTTVVYQRKVTILAAFSKFLLSSTEPLSVSLVKETHIEMAQTSEITAESYHQQVESVGGDDNKVSELDTISESHFFT